MSTHLIRFVAGEMSANVVNHMEPMWSASQSCCAKDESGVETFTACDCSGAGSLSNSIHAVIPV